MLARMGRCRIPSTLLKWGRYAGRDRMKSSVTENEAARRDPAAVRQQLEAAAREDRLDFITAAKILFSTPPKPKKFGLDFHLWQFFAACLPPFAVYLTAQYARYEIRRLEKEREQTDKSLLQAVVAEELASRLADEGDKTASEKSDKVASSSSKVPQEEQGSKPRSNDAIVQVSEEDLQAMKRRLEALETKLSMLESVRKATDVNAPSTSQPGSVIKSDGTSSHPTATHDEHEVQRKSIQNTVKNAERERVQQIRSL